MIIRRSKHSFFAMLIGKLFFPVHSAYGSLLLAVGTFGIGFVMRPLGAILLGGIFAKVISTANNYLFSPATNLIHDVYARFINRNASERQMLIVSRVLVLALGLFALLLLTLLLFPLAFLVNFCFGQ